MPEHQVLSAPLSDRQGLLLSAVCRVPTNRVPQNPSNAQLLLPSFYVFLILADHEKHVDVAPAACSALASLRPCVPETAASTPGLLAHLCKQQLSHTAWPPPCWWQPLHQHLVPKCCQLRDFCSPLRSRAAAVQRCCCLEVLGQPAICLMLAGVPAVTAA